MHMGHLAAILGQGSRAILIYDKCPRDVTTFVCLINYPLYDLNGQGRACFLTVAIQKLLEMPSIHARQGS